MPGRWQRCCADGSQQLHPLAGEEAGQSIPAFKGQVALVEALAALGAMPSVDEPALSFLLHRTANCEFHFAHWIPHEAH